MHFFPALVLALCAQSSPFVIDAGPDRVIEPPTSETVLQGSIRGQKHGELPLGTTITWAQLSGPIAELHAPHTLRPRLVPGAPGRLRLRLKVRFPDGSVAADDVLVHAFDTDQDGDLGGTARVWHTLTLTFVHTNALGETGTPNPFLDLRLGVWFWHPETRRLVLVPGFFAADGNAAESGASAGDRWRVHFTPDRAGTWFYLATFRAGAELALDLDPEAGTPASFDGANGTFEVRATDPDAPGFLSQGALQYVGRHHLRTAETHAWWLKGGANSPENLLGYFEFDNTFDQGGSASALDAQGGLHRFAPHLGDFTNGPLWRGGKGRALFGALEYLAARGVNSVYALTYNLDGGDGREVWPWIGNGADKLRFDVSKLAQWERVLARMNQLGIAWHVVTQEAENDHALDGGALGLARKLYYRELVARFAHAPGLVWNLGEENDGTPAERRAFADTLRVLDPYDHPIALHNRVGDLDGAFGTLLGTHLELVSLQGDGPSAGATVRALVADSAAAARPWVVNFDELNPADEGLVPDAVDPQHDTWRRESLWPTLLAGGGGVEWYFGYAFANADLDCEDFRSRENAWQQTRRALDFLREHVPFQDMRAADELVSGNAPRALALPGEFYLVYLPFGGSSTLDLASHARPFSVDWFHARDGGALQTGGVVTISGPGVRSLGTPPGSGDWIALVRRADARPPVFTELSVEPAVFVGDQDLTIRARLADPDGPSDAQTVTLEVTDPAGQPFGTFPLTWRGGDLWSLYLPDRPPYAPGTWQLRARTTDSAGFTAERTASFEAR
jgi:hypothetical protein